MALIRRISQEHQSGHSRFDDKRRAGIEHDDNALRDAADHLDTAANGLTAHRSQGGCHRHGAAGATASSQMLQDPTFNRRADSADHRFDFRQFRHKQETGEKKFELGVESKLSIMPNAQRIRSSPYIRHIRFCGGVYFSGCSTCFDRRPACSWWISPNPGMFLTLASVLTILNRYKTVCFPLLEYVCALDGKRDPANLSPPYRPLLMRSERSKPSGCKETDSCVNVFRLSGLQGDQAKRRR